MTPFLKRSSMIIFLLTITSGFSQSVNEQLIREIGSLHHRDSIRAYWNRIHQADQSNRGPGANPEIDLVNFKKMMLMIRYHGFPAGFAYGTKNSEADSLQVKNFTPNIVFTHQPSFRVREYFFPTLYQAYKEGKANEFWFLHTVKGLTLGRFDRIFYPSSVDYLDSNLLLMRHQIQPTAGFDPDIVDSLFQWEMNWKRQILTSKPVFTARVKPSNFKERIVRDQYVKLFSSDQRFYLVRIYLDGSYNAPQEVLFDPGEQRFYYAFHEEVLGCETELERLLTKRKRSQLKRAASVFQD